MSKLGPIMKGMLVVPLEKEDGNGGYVPKMEELEGRVLAAETDMSSDGYIKAGGWNWHRTWIRRATQLEIDAHNTANRTGKLPSELDAERDELLEAAKAVVKMLDQGQWTTAQYSRLVDLAKAIAKSTGK